jgi:hypothetical protein
MGGGLSIQQSNKQSVSTKIVQQSVEQCSIACSATTNINITAKGGSMRDLNFKNGCISNSASCSLKASLKSTIMNDLKSQQGATQFDVPGIFTVLGDLLGSKDAINQQNSQMIANEASQLMSSMCQDNTSVSMNVNLILDDVNLTDVNFNNLAKSNKFNCVINNMGSFYAQNDESNTQNATQVRIDGMVFLAIIIVIGVIAVAAIKYGFKRRNNNKQNDKVEDTVLKAAMDDKTNYLSALDAKPQVKSKIVSKPRPSRSIKFNNPAFGMK